LLSQWNKLARWYEAPVAVAPSQQPFRSHDVTAGQVYLRLVIEHQLIPLKRLTQIAGCGNDCTGSTLQGPGVLRPSDGKRLLALALCQLGVIN